MTGTWIDRGLLGTLRETLSADARPASPVALTRSTHPVDGARALGWSPRPIGEGTWSLDDDVVLCRWGARPARRSAWIIDGDGQRARLRPGDATFRSATVDLVRACAVGGADLALAVALLGPDGRARARLARERGRLEDAVVRAARRALTLAVRALLDAGRSTDEALAVARECVVRELARSYGNSSGLSVAGGRNVRVEFGLGSLTIRDGQGATDGPGDPASRAAREALAPVLGHVPLLGAAVLGRVHQEHLALALEADGRLRRSPRGARRARGAWFTPPELSAVVAELGLAPALERVARARDPLEALAALRVVDPACGSGRVLTAALDVLARAAIAAGTGTPMPLAVIRRRLAGTLVGIDLDPDALRLARAALALHVGAEDASRVHGHGLASDGERRSDDAVHAASDAATRMHAEGLAWNRERGPLDVVHAGAESATLVHADALAWDGERGAFDAVLGNPPWRRELGRGDALDGDGGQTPSGDGRASRVAQHARARGDLWMLFAHLALDLLRPGGGHAYVAPGYWLRGAGVAPLHLRERLRSEARWRALVDLGRLQGFDAGGASARGVVYAVEGAPAHRVTTERATADRATTEGATTEGATTEGATTDRATAEGATAEGATTDGAMADRATTEGATTEGATTEGATTDRATAEGATTDGAMADRATMEEGATTEGATADRASAADRAPSDAAHAWSVAPEASLEAVASAVRSRGGAPGVEHRRVAGDDVLGPRGEVLLDRPPGRGGRELLATLQGGALPAGWLLSEGITANPERLTRGLVRRLGAALPADARAGEPVFVLPAGALPGLRLSRRERTLLVPWLGHDDIDRLRAGEREPGAFLIHATAETLPRETEAPALVRHLARFRPVLEARRETRLGRRAWFHLHWPRDARIVDGPRVLVPRWTRWPWGALVERRCAVGESAWVLAPTDPGHAAFAAALASSAPFGLALLLVSKRRGKGVDVARAAVATFPWPDLATFGAAATAGRRGGRSGRAASLAACADAATRLVTAHVGATRGFEGPWWRHPDARVAALGRALDLSACDVLGVSYEAVREAAERALGAPASPPDAPTPRRGDACEPSGWIAGSTALVSREAAWSEAGLGAAVLHVELPDDEVAPLLTVLVGFARSLGSERGRTLVRLDPSVDGATLAALLRRAGWTVVAGVEEEPVWSAVRPAREPAPSRRATRVRSSPGR